MTTSNFEAQVQAMDPDSMLTMIEECGMPTPPDQSPETLRASILANWTPEQIAELPEDTDLTDWSI